MSRSGSAHFGHFTILRVCVLVPARMARTSQPLKMMGRSFTASLGMLGLLGPALPVSLGVGGANIPCPAWHVTEKRRMHGFPYVVWEHRLSLPTPAADHGAVRLHLLPHRLLADFGVMGGKDG